jgi:hypothetical protein
MSATRTATTQVGFDRALAAERRLEPIVRLVDAFCALVGPEHAMCSGCIWDTILKPLVVPLVGWERGYIEDEAKDPEPEPEPADDVEAAALALSKFKSRLRTAAEIMAEPEQPRVPATTDTERWMRSMEAYDAFTDVVLARLHEADPGNGHGIGRVRS